MAAIANGRQLDNTGVFQDFTGDTHWHTILTADASNFVAGGKYLIVAGISNLQTTSGTFLAQAQVVHAAPGAVELEAAADNILLEDGTGVLLLEGAQTSFADSQLRSSRIGAPATQGFQYVWFTVFTQPGAAEDIRLQVSTERAVDTVHAGPPFTIQWIRLDDDLTENTDWFYAETSTDDAMSTAFETRASVSVDPPAAGDDWLILATHRHRADSESVNVNTRLVSDPSGSPVQLGGLWEDEATDSTDERVRTHLWAVDNHGDAAVTYAIQDQVESGSLPDHLASAIFALNLSKFAQSVLAFDADAIADVASYTDITPDAWANPTVGTTGDWWVLGHFIDDVATTAQGTRPRLTVDAVDEPWDHTAGRQVHSTEITGAPGALVITRPTLTAGSRDINLEAIAVDGISGVWRDRFLVAWSMELAAGGTVVTPAVVAVTSALPTPTILAVAVVAQTTVAAVASLPTPAILAAAQVTPAVVAVTASLPTPTVLAAATVTPTTFAVTAALPTPTVLAAALVAPATVAVVVTLPTPTVTIDARVTPATVAAVAALATPTILAAVATAPAVVAVLTTLPTPTVLAAVVVTPAVVAAVTTLPAPAALGAAAAAPAVIPVTTTLPTPDIDVAGGSVTVNPDVIAVTVSLPIPTVLAGAVVAPTVIAATAALPTPTAQGATSVAPATVAAQVALPAPTILAASTVTPAVVPLTVTLPAPTILAAANVAPAVVPVTVTLPTPTVQGVATVTPVAVAVTLALPTPAVLAASTVTPAVIPLVTTLPTPTIDVVGGAVTVTPAVIAATVALPTPVAQGAASVAPATIPVTVTLPTPTVRVEVFVTPATLAVVTTLPFPTLIAGAVVAPAVVPLLAALPTPQPSIPASTAPTTIAAITALATPTILTAHIVSPSTIVLVVGVPTPGVQGAISVFPATVTVLVTFPGPNIIIGAFTFWQPDPMGYVTNRVAYTPDPIVP